MISYYFFFFFYRKQLPKVPKEKKPYKRNLDVKIGFIGENFLHFNMLTLAVSYTSARSTQTYTPALLHSSLSPSARHPALRGLLGICEVSDSIHVGQGVKVKVQAVRVHQVVPDDGVHIALQTAVEHVQVQICGESVLADASAAGSVQEDGSVDLHGG